VIRLGGLLVVLKDGEFKEIYKYLRQGTLDE
jgi:hypothetical protein